MNAAKVLLFPELASIYDKICQSCIGGTVDLIQTFGSNINVWSERSERPISHTALEFKKIRERQRTPSERSEQLSSSLTRVVVCRFVVFFLFACLFLFVLVYIILIIVKRRPFRKEAWQVRGKAAFSR